MSVRDPNDALKLKAQTLQAGLGQVVQVEKSEEDLLARLESIADEYHELGNLWDNIGDPNMARQTRQEEQQIRALMLKLSELAGITASEAKVILDEVRATLRTVAGQSDSK